MPLGLTRALGAFASTLQFDHIPAAARDAIKLGFTDCVAVMFAGAGDPGVEILRRQIAGRGLSHEAKFCGNPGWATAADVALVNGMAGHVLDYDDIALGGHPSVVLVPAILAEAQALGLDGRAAMTAYATGFECWARIVEKEQDQYHQKGWHPTSVIGPVAAAAAVANLRRLTPVQATNALGIAASMCSGLVANFGSMTKSFQVGLAASSGITAARLAGSDFTASETALEDPVGLLGALSPRGAVDRESGADDLGRDWRILARGLMIKRYPMCGASHRSIDALLDLRSQHQLEADDIAAIETRIGRTQATVLRNHRPRTAMEARFSMEFALAAAVTAGKVGLSEFTDAFVARSDVRLQMEKVSIYSVDEQAEDEPIFAPFDVVTVVRADGTRLESPPIKHPRGHWSVPLSPGEVWEKFCDCTRSSLSASDQRELFASLQDLEKMGSVSDIVVSGSHNG